MKNSDKIYAKALYSALEGKEEIGPIIYKFLTLLKEKAQLHRIDKIIYEFENIYNKKNDIVKLKIKSAYRLERQLVNKVANALNIPNYELEMETDKDLIGGFVAQYNDTLIDMSIKNSLNKLQNQLKQ